MHLKHGKGAPLVYLEWNMALKTGWTLEYIAGLSIARMHEWLAIEHGTNKAIG